MHGYRYGRWVSQGLFPSSQAMYLCGAVLLGGCGPVGITHVEPYDVVAMAAVLRSATVQVVLPPLDASGSVADGVDSAAAQTGADLVFSLRITNPNAARARVAGGSCTLSVNEGYRFHHEAGAVIVQAGGAADYLLRYPLRLDDPSLDAPFWTGLLHDDPVQMGLSGDLAFSLVVESIVAPGAINTLGVDTVRINLVTSGFTTSPDAEAIATLQRLVADLL